MDAREYFGVSGVYKIENIRTGKVYIGSSVNIGRRWYTHFRQLSLGTHRAKHLQNAWNKYGPEDFSFTVLELVVDSQQLVSVEQQWIDIYESYDPQRGYNTCPVAGSLQGVKHSETAKKKISEAKRGVPLSIEHRSKLSLVHKEIPILHHVRIKLAESLAKDWIVIDPEGNTHFVHNLKKLCRDNGLNVNCMRQIALGKQKQHKGWKCQYA